MQEVHNDTVHQLRSLRNYMQIIRGGITDWKAPANVIRNILLHVSDDRFLVSGTDCRGYVIVDNLVSSKYSQRIIVPFEGFDDRENMGPTHSEN